MWKWLRSHCGKCHTWPTNKDHLVKSVSALTLLFLHISPPLSTGAISQDWALDSGKYSVLDSGSQARDFLPDWAWEYLNSCRLVGPCAGLRHTHHKGDWDSFLVCACACVNELFSLHLLPKVLPVLISDSVPLRCEPVPGFLQYSWSKCP